MQAPPNLPTIPLDKVEALRNELSDLFAVADTAMDQPQPGQVRFRGRFLQDLADHYDELRRRFEKHGFTPLVRQEDGRLAIIGIPFVFEPKPSNWWVNLALFLATILSTLFLGAVSEAKTAEEAWQIWRGWPFSLSILLILGAHEMGHYFVARYHKVDVTLPYFIPLPPPFLTGTLGAFILIKEPIKNRRALLDIGVAGPLAGMVFALPILIYGLMTSPVGAPGGGLLEGNSLLYAGLKVAIFGRMLPSGGEDVLLNSVAWAGWVGLLVTGLNLIPVGQLDGGHVAYVLFGRQARQLFWPIVGCLLLLAVITSTPMWLLWVGLLYFLGQHHAEPLDDVTPLDPRRRAVAIFALILFLLVFVPIPLTPT